MKAKVDDQKLNLVFIDHHIDNLDWAFFSFGIKTCIITHILIKVRVICT